MPEPRQNKFADCARMDYRYVDRLLVLSQVVLGLQLPFAFMPVAIHDASQECACFPNNRCRCAVGIAAVLVVVLVVVDPDRNESSVHKVRRR